MKAARRHAGGVTLIEALVVLALLAILAALAAPALGQMVAQQRLQTTAAELAGALALTRSEAIKQGQRMVLCRAGPEPPPNQRCATNSNAINAPAHQWTAGWLLFADLNGNAQREDGETLLRVGSAAPMGVLVRGNAPVARYVSYMPKGHTLLVTGAFQAGTLTLCRAGLSPSPAVQIVISRNGRPRQQQAVVANCV
ncbi:GspH/FimT family protein [Serpentinimonas barnesii]|uniref:GspH/FimT family protein n=1 Tax=Serpentinimonas barnesii TaxID=1458427 RepID=UPI000496D114|nr:GspH/FimT family protein [Serpentinimonas barnesii]